MDPGSDIELHGRAAYPEWIENFTTHIDAVDKDRNMVTITSSVASNFGSAMYIDGEGPASSSTMRWPASTSTRGTRTAWRRASVPGRL